MYIYIYIYIYICIHIYPWDQQTVATTTVTTFCSVNLAHLNEFSAGFEPVCGYSCSGYTLLLP